MSGRRVLKESTVRSLQTDWLRLKRASKIRDPPGWGSPDDSQSFIGGFVYIVRSASLTCPPQQ